MWLIIKIQLSPACFPEEPFCARPCLSENCQSPLLWVLPAELSASKQSCKMPSCCFRQRSRWLNPCNCGEESAWHVANFLNIEAEWRREVAKTRSIVSLIPHLDSEQLPDSFMLPRYSDSRCSLSTHCGTHIRWVWDTGWTKGVPPSLWGIQRVGYVSPRVVTVQQHLSGPTSSSWTLCSCHSATEWGQDGGGCSVLLCATCPGPLSCGHR